MTRPTGFKLNPREAFFARSAEADGPLQLAGLTVLERRVKTHSVMVQLETAIPMTSPLGQMIESRGRHLVWVSAEGFSPAAQVEEIMLPKPGSDVCLRKCVGELLSKPLPESLPPWRLYVLQGLYEERTALLLIIHPSLASRASITDVWNALCAPSPREDALAGVVANDGFDDEALFTEEELEAPRRAGMLGDALATGREALTLARRFRGSSLFGLVAQGAGEIGRDLTRPGAHLPFHADAFSGERNVSWTAFSLREVRAIKGITSCSLHDIVLAIVGGAIQQYCEHHRFPLEGRKVRMFVPITFTRPGSRDIMDRTSTVLPVDVPVEGHGVLSRLHAVRERIALLKAAKVPAYLDVAGQVITGLGDSSQRFIPAGWSAGRTAGLLRRLTANTTAGLVCSVSEGPQVPFYCLGAKVKMHVPFLPPLGGMGLNVSTYSYNQMLYVGIACDKDVVPDIRRFTTLLEQAYNRLRRTTHVEKLPPVELKPLAAPWNVRERESVRKSARAHAPTPK